LVWFRFDRERLRLPPLDHIGEQSADRTDVVVVDELEVERGFPMTSRRSNRTPPRPARSTG